MDPTKHIKVMFGDLLMQLAVVQAQLEACQQELYELKNNIGRVERNDEID